MHREPLRDDAYWQKWITDCIESVKEMEEKLEVKPFPEKWKKNTITQGLYYDCKRLITLKYSGGIPVAEIANDYPRLLDAWVAYNQNISTGDNKKHLLLTNDYYRVLTLVSWGIIFNAPSELFQKIANHIHSNGEDELVETLLATRLPDRRHTDWIIFPTPFELLYKVTQAPPTEKAALMKKYLTNWYKNMKKYINYDAHKAKGEGGFEGYWSFEAAAVVALYHIDDSSFRDMDFYPGDMADFAKTNF